MYRYIRVEVESSQYAFHQVIYSKLIQFRLKVWSKWDSAEQS